ncbi:MAG: TatD family hydrolase [Candidatus Woesearchaeota archaeon]
MKLVDVHVHLDFPEYKKDINELIKNCESKGVRAIVANGVNKKSNREILKLSEKFDVVKPALGIYPTDAHSMSFEEIDDELDFIKKSKPKGYGEVGLDNKYLETKEQKEKQEHAFEGFLKLSEKTKKPLIIHSRKAEQEIIERLESSNAKAVMHCFMGKKRLVQKASDLGYSFSVLPIIIKLEQLKQLVEYVPLKQLLTETDGPFMSLTDKRNEPSEVIHSVKEIARIKKIEEDEAANIIFMNYQKMFK